LEALVESIADGASVAIAPDYSGCAMAAVRALIRKRVKDLHLVTVPQAGFQADMLIGAGCVASVETAGVTLGEHGTAPRFSEAVRSGAIEIRDATCPAIHAALQASEKGIPFMPLRGILGSDVLANRSDWRVIDNPFGADGPIVLLPAIRPDVALFHARRADARGNVWVGVRRELMLMAHAAARTLVTVEEITDGDLLADDAHAAGTIPAIYVSAVAEVPRGAWPVGLAGAYPPDSAHLAEYARLARTASGFEQYLDEHVRARASAA
ncbi:MAG: CoA-transferase, partial [Gammaproteobacteria bacterium]|nr:CoA-transferase [Gammaproteobacteria bacterium]